MDGSNRNCNRNGDRSQARIGRLRVAGESSPKYPRGHDADTATTECGTGTAAPGPGHAYGSERLAGRSPANVTTSLPACQVLDRDETPTAAADAIAPGISTSLRPSTPLGICDSADQSSFSSRSADQMDINTFQTAQPLAGAGNASVHGAISVPMFARRVSTVRSDQERSSRSWDSSQHCNLPTSDTKSQVPGQRKGHAEQSKAGTQVESQRRASRAVSSKLHTPNGPVLKLISPVEKLGTERHEQNACPPRGAMALLAHPHGATWFRQGGGWAATGASDSTRHNLTAMPPWMHPGIMEPNSGEETRVRFGGTREKGRGPRTRDGVDDTTLRG
ncbi:hypothetical protein G7Y89_g2456 [Cudoniella acicularis]|uniref:Uncharacterized protein n=1 Tax=Cudoniella acicularis TaxID=354080 RepID=A0A8H4RVB2_9HELO|nr:hypothetical protein G7Y89_g2456 [Cudoniella acicularis]